jgi:large subunit ribosomal protein L32
MAEPKVKRSRSNTHSRRANWKAATITLVKCPQCKQDTLPHTVCSNCGNYKNKTY